LTGEILKIFRNFNHQQINQILIKFMVKLKLFKKRFSKINVIYFLLLSITLVIAKAYASEQALINNMLVKEPTNVIVPSLLNAIPSPKAKPENPSIAQNNNAIPNSNVHQVQETAPAALQQPTLDNKSSTNKPNSIPPTTPPTVAANQQTPISNNLPSSLPTKVSNTPPSISNNPNPNITNDKAESDTDSAAKLNSTEVPKNISDTTKKPAEGNLNLWFGSMMFDTKTFSAIKNAIKEHELNKEIIEKAITEGKPIPANAQVKPGQVIAAPLPTTSPSFTLNSIIYKGLDNWVIWINKKKFTFNSSEGIIPDLNIENVNSNEVEAVFKTSFIDHLSPNWTRMVIKNKQGEYVSRDRAIKINSDRKTVKFKLRPNQTFVFYDMDIAEGFVSDRAVAVNTAPLATGNGNPTSPQVPGAINPATLQTPGAVNPTMSQGTGNANSTPIKNQ
jgi:hypothetical protein